MQNKKSSILIVGESSYLASGLEFDKDKYVTDRIKRPYEGINKELYKNYDYIINFCIQPEQFTEIISEDEMIDVKIAQNIAGSNAKFIFLSSRKVYGSSIKLQKYKETDELKPYDFYSKNKATIETKLQQLIPNNLLILRVGNVIGEPTRKNNKTFIGWIEKELKEKGKVYCTILPDTRKDFITKDYFQSVLAAVIENNLTGIYNVGAGFALPMKEFLLNLLSPNLVDFSKATDKAEQFVLNVNKLHKYVKPFTIDMIDLISQKINNTRNI